mmetsp:Transcript_2163/g.3114  ORF Transcript_2163/g.3114 Transcript_2163/m.3114 type:complete len:324 (-) Transcript_2163:70-1041(-)|eukprot:CAMPEP_0178923382 /NCGR_PEP_ID=MMETSP0786-20121207/16690_1 /TAXON_ID=186022 /ORGANISM="Thalassionema frauenfeldii, Strain CCMP 1798" /LENGTH=323 /DNA_ID=CAMNT_0020597875 /DNA_START=18 /DNA_END=986 /DNA_ORIENTATION=-
MTCPSPTLWNFRPSSLSSDTNVYTLPSSRRDLEDFYEEDNHRARQEGVGILPKSSQTKLRTCQWNINNGFYLMGKLLHTDIQQGILDAIRHADADVVVLNEYHHCQYFENQLKSMGYSSLLWTSKGCPTAIATRLRVDLQKDIRLSYERSALLMRVQVPHDNESCVWVVGTHLDYQNGKQRNREIRVLLDKLGTMGILSNDEATSAVKRTVLVGDLNQQRPHDYAPHEWRRIRSGMVYRRSCQDDGVSKLLTDQGFVCAWDYNDNSKEATTTRTNWETPHPPSTHWSGTIVDYSYGRNITAVAVSIDSVACSDHRMTVCDWSW